MSERHPALDAVRNRVILAATTGNAETLLTAEARRQAAELAAVVDVGHNVEAALWLGMFHWQSYLVLPDGADLEDYLAAVRFLGPVCDVDPQLVPSPIRERYERIRANPGAPPPDPIELNSRARNCVNTYERTGELPALGEAVTLLRAALAAAEGVEPDLTSRKSDLAVALRRWFERVGDPGVIAEAISLLRDVVASAPDDELPVLRANLAVALLSRHELTGHGDSLTEAIALLETAASGVAEDAPERLTIVADLAAARSKVAQTRASRDALAEAVESHRRVLAGCPEDHPDRGHYLSNLGTALQGLAERTGDRDVLAEAAETLRAALGTCPGNHPDLATYLSNYAAALVRLSEATGNAAALREAVDYLRAALAATPEGDLGRRSHLGNFAVAASRLGVRTSQTGLLREAVEASRQAVNLIPDGHPERASHLSTLGLALQTLYEHTGDTALLTEAMSVQRTAIAVARANDLNEAGHLSRLGLMLGAMFTADGDTGRLAEAIAVGRASVAASPSGHPALAGYLSNLGSALLTMFERTEQDELLTEAIATLQAAAGASSPGNPDRAACLSNLGLALYTLFEQTGRQAPLRAAITAHRDAIAGSPAGQPGRAGYLSNLGIALQALAGGGEDAGLLDEAISLFRTAVRETGEDDVDLATYLANLGNALWLRHDRSPAIGSPGKADFLTEAARCYTQAAERTGAPVLTRIYAYRQASRLAVLAGSGGAALAAAEAAVALLSQVSPRILLRADRERRVGQIAGLAGDVAVAAISAGDPERAAELLEQTRGVLVADTLQARSGDLATLRATASGAALAREFEELRRRAEILDSIDILDSESQRRRQQGGFASDIPPELYQAGARQAAENFSVRRQRAYQELEAMIARIRGAGFPDFLRPPGIAKLARQANQGPIVYVCTSPTRCYALILSETVPRVRAIPLPRLTETDAYRHANQFYEARTDAHPGSGSPAQERISARTLIQDTLQWLWDTIAEPVLTALGYVITPRSEKEWPRLWWCPVGILAYLPLHAAGHHADLNSGDPVLLGSPRTVLDRVVSSYTPTVRALAYARGLALEPRTLPPLIVAVPDAPGTTPLPGVAAEAKALAEIMPSSDRLPEPTRQHVLDALPSYPAVHFACHGYANLIDPGASELVVPDRENAPLTLNDIAELRLNATLAFLSACETLVVRQDLADEAVHLTGAFLFAGYQNVIGTLWNIKDTAAKDLAVDFYARLMTTTTTAMAGGGFARSLHHATRSMRARYLNLPSLWVAHTHTGT